MTARLTGEQRGTLYEVRFDDGGMNLLSAAALGELGRLLDALPRGIRIVSFASARPGVFAAGADMKEMAAFSPGDADSFSRLGQELFSRIARLGPLTVAIVDGECFGGALDLILAFDVRIASSRSRFRHPGAGIGIVTGFGGTSRWRTAVDRRAASALFLDNAVVTAAQAVEMGVIDALYDGDAGREALLSTIREREAAIATAARLGALAPAAPQHQLLLAQRLHDLHSGRGFDGTD